MDLHDNIYFANCHDACRSVFSLISPYSKSRLKIRLNFHFLLILNFVFYFAFSCLYLLLHKADP